MINTHLVLVSILVYTFYVSNTTVPRQGGAMHFFAPLACWRGVVGMSQEMVD